MSRPYRFTPRHGLPATSVSLAFFQEVGTRANGSRPRPLSWRATQAENWNDCKNPEKDFSISHSLQARGGRADLSPRTGRSGCGERIGPSSQHAEPVEEAGRERRTPPPLVGFCHSNQAMRRTRIQSTSRSRSSERRGSPTRSRKPMSEIARSASRTPRARRNTPSHRRPRVSKGTTILPPLVFAELDLGSSFRGQRRPLRCAGLLSLPVRRKPVLPAAGSGPWSAFFFRAPELHTYRLRTSVRDRLSSRTGETRVCNE